MRTLFSLLVLALLAACAPQAPQSGLRLVLELDGDSALLAPTVDVLRKRVDVAGDRYTTISPIAPNRIDVFAPGIVDPSGISKFLTRPGVLTFNLVDDEADPADWQPQIERDGRVALPDDSNGGQLAVIFSGAIVTGSDIAEASQIDDKITGRPSISFTLSPEAASRFGVTTADNIGHRLAIVLDNRIISAPIIQSSIMDGRGEINGDFGSSETREIVLMLRAGALPARLKVIETSTFGEASP